MNQTETGLNPMQMAASDPCRCRFGKDEGTDAPHRLPDPGQRRQSMEYYGDHLYE